MEDVGPFVDLYLLEFKLFKLAALNMSDRLNTHNILSQPRSADTHQFVLMFVVQSFETSTWI